MNTTTPLPRTEQQTSVQKCYQAAVKTLDTMDADAQGHLTTDLAQLASRLLAQDEFA